MQRQKLSSMETSGETEGEGSAMSEAKESELLAEAEFLLREVWVQYRMERRVKGVMQGYSASSMQTIEQVQDYLLKRGQINKDGYFEEHEQ